MFLHSPFSREPPLPSFDLSTSLCSTYYQTLWTPDGPGEGGSLEVAHPLRPTVTNHSMSYYLSTKGQNAGTLADGFPQKRRDEDSSERTTFLAPPTLGYCSCEQVPSLFHEGSLHDHRWTKYTALSKEDLVIHITLNELCNTSLPGPAAHQDFCGRPF